MVASCQAVYELVARPWHQQLRGLHLCLGFSSSIGVRLLRRGNIATCLDLWCGGTDHGLRQFGSCYARTAVAIAGIVGMFQLALCCCSRPRIKFALRRAVSWLCSLDVACEPINQSTNNHHSGSASVPAIKLFATVHHLVQLLVMVPTHRYQISVLFSGNPLITLFVPAHSFI